MRDSNFRASLKPEEIVEKRGEELSIEIIRTCHEHQSDHRTKTNKKKIIRVINLNLESESLEYKCLPKQHSRRKGNPRKRLV